MDKISRYQIEQLMRENERLNERLNSVPAWAQALFLHAQRFYWTITRLVGLGHLHDGTRNESAIGDALARSLRAVDAPARARAQAGERLFFDATVSAHARHLSGIPRVVVEICRAAAQSGAGVPVVIENGRFCDLADKSPIVFRPGDRILLLDAGWNMIPVYCAALEAARMAGAEGVLGVYDLVPIHYPGVTTLATALAFENWFRQLLPHCCAAVAISRATALEFDAWLQQSGEARAQTVSVGWFHLGADLDSGPRATPGAPTHAALTARPFFLSVGTLEPRKGYPIALDAMERVWARGCDVNYAIVGRRGWSAGATADRIAAHPENGRRLFWLDNVDDDELARLYAAARALVYPSIAEGFGLPIIEAAHFGAPIIASDIPIFREVAGDRIDYFEAADPQALADSIVAALARPRAAQAIPALTWKESAAVLTDLIAHRAYQIARPSA